MEQIDDTIKDLMSSKLEPGQEDVLREKLKTDEYRHKFQVAYVIWRQIAIHYSNKFQPSEAWKKMPQQEFRRVSLIDKRWFRAVATIAILVTIGLPVYYGIIRTIAQAIPPMVLVDVPNGSRTHIVLPDQTSVWLNAGSQLQYAEDFTEQRHVMLNGEAIFDVTPDKTRPFVVQNGDFQVEVLGTVFELKAYTEDTNVRLTVVEGLVQAIAENETVKVKPSQQIIFDKQTREISSQTVNPEHVTSWKDGRYFFRNYSFAEICRQMERLFDLKIIINRPGLADETFYVDFVHDESPEKMLKIMDVENRWKLTANDKTFVID